jgi:hypothetical protein
LNKTLLRNIGGGAIAVWLAVQAVVPLGPWFIEPWEGRADFSWDMFSYRRRCPGKICPGFFATYADGGRKRTGWGKGFNSKVQIARIRYRGRLQEYGRWLCEDGALGDDVVKLEGACECWYGRPGPPNKPHWIMEEGRNYCAPDEGAAGGGGG